VTIDYTKRTRFSKPAPAVTEWPSNGQDGIGVPTETMPDARLNDLRDATRAFLAADRAVQEGEAENANRARKDVNLRPLYSRRLALARALAFTAERVTG
jgi:hypothetical protein